MGDDPRLRRYAWQLEFRLQPYPARYLAYVFHAWENLPGIHLAGLNRLRVHLGTVGDSTDVSYGDAHALVEAVSERLRTIEQADVDVSGIVHRNGGLVLQVRDSALLDTITDVIRSCADDIPGLHPDMATDRHCLLALADTDEAAARALDALTEANLRDQVEQVHVRQITHVLLNDVTFTMPIWTHLDQVRLAEPAPAAG
jgi:hypothetical protein